MSESLIGWDIGGAHLKYAVADTHGLSNIGVIPTPVWEDVSCIERSIRSIIDTYPHATRHAVTMTAELTDAFTDRHHGVRQIIQSVETALSGKMKAVYLSHDANLISARLATREPEQVASAKWCALPTLLASHQRSGVIMDLGSTTCDLIPFSTAGPLSQARDDLQRLRSSELVYTGVVRTPVCAVVQTTEFAGYSHGIAAELFANMADVYRVLDRLPDNADLYPTCDGNDKTVNASLQRLARLLCTDAATHQRSDWTGFAQSICNQQCHLIDNALNTVLMQLPQDSQSTVFGAGVGQFLLKELAATKGLNYESVGAALTQSLHLRDSAARHAPAAALALLALSDDG